MMHIWFEGKIRFTRTMENGMEKKVTESYLLDALSFTEAEEKLIEEMQPLITGEFSVSGIKKANFSEVFPSNDAKADRWYKCKLNFIMLDEKTGIEKRTAVYMLVQSDGFRNAVKELDEHMKGTLADYEIVSVSETAIMDVFPYGRREGENE